MKTFKVSFYYWIATLFFLLLAIYWSNSDDAVIDINVHDTYYVISNAHICIFLAIIYALLGFIYWLLQITKIQLIKNLTKIHSIITLSCIPAYYIGRYIFETRTQSQFPLFDDTTNLIFFLTILWLIVLLSQLSLIINILISVIRFFNKNKQV